MGFDISCIDESFSCGYIHWNTIRTTVIEATLDYIKHYISLNPPHENTNDEFYQNEIILFMEKIIENKEDSVDALIYFCNLVKLDLLIQFGVGGLYALCNKGDCDGYYSVGNSYDICHLFTLIKPFIQDQEIYHSILQVEKIFIESIEKKTIVSVW